LETELQQMNDNFAQQSEAKDDMLRSLQGTQVSKVSNLLDQVTMWKNKYEQLAKLYSQLRQEHLELLSKFKSMQLKANSAQEAIDKKERIEREMKSKNLELADMIRERDRARYELDRLKGVIRSFRIRLTYSGSKR
jgi:DNA repair exonuclease SbcCD ATPase subunit